MIPDNSSPIFGNVFIARKNNLKLNDAYEIGMYYEAKNKGMNDDNIITSIAVLRIINEMK